MEDSTDVVVNGRQRVEKLLFLKVSPAELEGVLLMHPSILDCAVLGIPCDTYGEIPKAFVKIRETCEISEEEVIDLIKGIYFQSIENKFPSLLRSQCLCIFTSCICVTLLSPTHK